MKSTLARCVVRSAFISGFVVICQLAIPAVSDPCSNAVNIGDYRRSVTSTPTAADSLLCDVNINETLWYRFDAFTGGKMPESCVSIMHCGTFLPIWMNGVHPTAADPGPKAVEACAPFWLGFGDCCQWKANITVRRCQNTTSDREYFVYRLKRPPFCSMSYCAGVGLPCDRNCSWNGVRQNCSCPAYPTMTDTPELKPPRVITSSTMVSDLYQPARRFFPTRFVVDCVAKYPPKTVDDGARFDVVFEVNGYYLTHFTVNSIDPVATLDESHLVGHLGKELTCKVSSRWDSSDIGSRYQLSNRRWFGLAPIDKADAVVSGNLVVKEGETVSLWMQPTFPITTRPCFDVPHLPCLYSSYSLAVHAASNDVKLSDCAVVLNHNSTRSVELEISPVPAVGTRPKPVIWQLSFDAYNDTAMNLPLPDELRPRLTPIFKGYTIQSINIEVRDRDAPPQCESIGDPHITTFPDAAGARNYYHVYGVGEFYLVRLNSRVLEIQVRHIPCGSRYSCNCGVIAREGNSIIGVTKCNQPSPLLIEYQLDNVSPTGTIHTTSEGWKISLLSGIVIVVTGWGSEFMNLYVTGLRTESTQYDGLCSSSVPRNSECTTACDRYRVPPSQSFFSITRSSLPQCGPAFLVPTCSCVGRGVHGTLTGDSIKVSCENPIGDYLLRIDLTRVCASRRKKRSTDADDDDDDIYDDFISLEDFNSNPLPLPTTTTTTTRPTTTNTIRSPVLRGQRHRIIGESSGRVDFNNVLQSASVRRHDVSYVNMGDVFATISLSLEDGRSRCRESLQLTPTYDLCSSRVDSTGIVETCALDVQMMNDYGPAASAPTQFEITCLSNIRRSLESYNASGIAPFQALKNLLTRVEKLVCPLQCNQKGRCVNGSCQCNAGFMGIDCSLRQGQVPSVQKMFSSVCDINKHPCKQIHLVATDVTIPENVVCKMRSVNGIVNGIPAIQYSAPVVSGGLVVCTLPSKPIISRGEVTNASSSTVVYLLQVSISNDGRSYSSEFPFTVFDGRCMQCPPLQNSPCQLKSNTCAIIGRCYRAGDRNPENVTRSCNPAKCQTKWTGESSVNCNDGF